MRTEKSEISTIYTSFSKDDNRVASLNVFGQHVAFLRNVFGQHVAFLRNVFGQHVAFLRNVFGQHVAFLRNVFGQHVAFLRLLSVSFAITETKAILHALKCVSSHNLNLHYAQIHSHVFLATENSKIQSTFTFKIFKIYN
jgi:hypothetical protein